MRNEIAMLFQKYIDNSCSEDELDRFYAYLKLSETDSEINRILTELWDYSEFTYHQDSDYFNNYVDQTGEKSQSIDKEEQEINNHKNNAGNEEFNGEDSTQ